MKVRIVIHLWYEPLVCKHEPIVLWTWTHCFVNMNRVEPIVLWTWTHCFVNMNSLFCEHELWIHCFVNMNPMFCEHEPLVCENELLILWTWTNYFVNMNPLAKRTWTHWQNMNPLAKRHETHYYYVIIIVLWKLTHCFENMNLLVCELESIGSWTWTHCFVNMNPLFCSIIDSHCFVSITWTHWFSLLMNINSKVPSDSLVHIWNFCWFWWDWWSLTLPGPKNFTT